MAASNLFVIRVMGVKQIDTKDHLKTVSMTVYAVQWMMFVLYSSGGGACWAVSKDHRLYQLKRQWRRSVFGDWISLSSSADDCCKQKRRGHSSKKAERETRQPRATPHQENPKVYVLISSC